MRRGTRTVYAHLLKLLGGFKRRYTISSRSMRGKKLNTNVKKRSADGNRMPLDVINEGACKLSLYGKSCTRLFR